MRLSYLVVQESLADAFSKGMTQLYRPGFPPIQAAMADFMQEGHFASHIRKMRAIYATRRSLLQQNLKHYFGDAVQFSSGQAGIHLAVTIGAAGTARKMIQLAPAHGLTLRGAYHIDPDRLGDNLLVLGYGGVKETDIEGAVKRLRGLYDVVQFGQA